ncbi:MAG: agmatinase family protein [Phycisphaerales bacterium]
MPAAKHPAKKPSKPAPTPAFDPNAAAAGDGGIFGLPFTPEQARIVLLPVPFDATTSYGGGAAAGPRALFEASMQVDLLDHQFGEVYKAGIAMLDEPGKIRKLSKKARKLAAPIIAAGGATKKTAEACAKVNAASAKMNAQVEAQTRKVLAAGKVPGILGGDHSTPLGAIRACADFVAKAAKDAGGAGGGSKPSGLGILHIDAHMDLRSAFEGFTYSHASIMFNVLREVGGVRGVSRIVQVGIRDYCPAERDVARKSGARVSVYFDQDNAEAMMRGTRWPDLCAKMVAELPEQVYVSFDIDGLDPSLCPHTGTPVPGGLTFAQASTLLKTLADSGRRVVGFDLVEVCPSPMKSAPEWDANVGARILYKLCGVAAATNR